MTCIFEGSLNDVIMAQHAKELKLLAGKGLVSSVASFLSLWSLLSHSYFYECACSTNFSFQTQLRMNGLMQMDK